MRRNTVVLTVALLLIMALSTVASAANRVGVIDLALIMDESKAGRRANALLEEFIAERQEALLPLEEQIEALAAELENAESMSDAEREALQAEFDEVVNEYVTQLNQYEAEIDAALQQLREQILSDIGAVLQMVGDSRGFDLIIDTSMAYYYRRVVDLTFEVIREYDDLWDQAQLQAGD